MTPTYKMTDLASRMKDAPDSLARAIPAAGLFGWSDRSKDKKSTPKPNKN